MAAGKFMAFIAGRFTAFTVCGVMTHSRAVHRLAQLARALPPVLEQLGALGVAVGVALHDLEAGVVGPRVGIADADLEHGELGLGLLLRGRRHPVEAVDALPERGDEVGRPSPGPAPSPRAGNSARRRACPTAKPSASLVALTRALPAVPLLLGAAQHRAEEGERLPAERAAGARRPGTGWRGRSGSPSRCRAARSPSGPRCR